MSGTLGTHILYHNSSASDSDLAMSDTLRGEMENRDQKVRGGNRTIYRYHLRDHSHWPLRYRHSPTGTGRDMGAGVVELGSKGLGANIGGGAAQIGRGPLRKRANSTLLPHI